MIREDRRSLLATGRLREQLRQSVTEEDIVAQHHGHAITSNEIRANNKGFGEPGRSGLLRIAETNAPLPAISEQPFELTTIRWRGDNENVSNACQHQGRQRIVDHRLFVDWEQLFPPASCNRITPRSTASCQYDPLQHACNSFGISSWSRHSSSEDRQGGSRTPKTRSALDESRQEFFGRRAGVGYSAVVMACNVGTCRPRRARLAKMAVANPCQLVSPLPAR